MLNKVEFIGNLTQDLKMRTTNTSGKSVCNLDIALNYYVNGEKKSEYVQVIVWEKQAEDAVKYLSKGRQVYVEAKVIIRKKEINGTNISIPEFHADKVLYLGASNVSGTNNQQESSQSLGHQSEYKDSPFQQKGNGNNQNHRNNPFAAQNGGNQFNTHSNSNYQFGR